jgi:CRISPR-associated endonuclease/helicase Cas3
VVVLRKRERGSEDEIYGKALRNTWQWLKGRVTKRRPTVDFGVQGLDALIEQDGSQGLDTESSSGPLLFPAHVETWTQTDPAPVPDPDVAPFLHGREVLESADVQIVWRADLNQDNPGEWVDVVTLAPPVVREALPVPLAAARRWLQQEPVMELADVEGSIRGEAESDEAPGHRPFLVWRGPDRSYPNGRIAPGDTIVVPVACGGADEFGWFPTSKHGVADIGDLCVKEMADYGLRRYRLRLDVDLLFPRDPAQQTKDKRERFTGLLDELRESRENQEPPGEKLEALFGFLREHKASNSEVLDTLDKLKDPHIRFYPSGSGCVLTSRRRVKSRSEVSVKEFSEDATDEDDSSSFTSRMTLSAHTQGVVQHTGKFARCCGLADELVEDLVLAARLHDLGKCDLRFQAMLQGGSHARAAAEAEPLAKSVSNQAVAEYREALRRSGYPKGARHEFTSVALVRGRRVLESAHDQELVLHLIGTHHGYGRPFPPVCCETQPVTVYVLFGGERLEACSAHGMERLDAGWTDQFWTLIRRYGFWGLAYLEAILRRADCVQSRKEQEQCTRSS